MIDFNNLMPEQVQFREEMQKTLAIINVAYPNWKVENKVFTLNTWMEMLQDYDANVIQMAVKSYISTDTSGFAPAIGQIIGIIHSFTEKHEMSAIEAWSYVRKALNNGYYGCEEEFNKLPEICQKVIGNPSVLREWSNMSTDMVDNTVFANFRRSYDVEVKQSKEFKRLPSDVKNLIESTSEKLSIAADE